MEKVQPEYLFELSEPLEGVSTLGQAVLHLAEISERIANEERHLVDHNSGRPENVAEHSNMLSVIAAAIAEEFYPELDANLIARYASVHDLVEAYVGDTPTHSINAQGLLDKEALELLGLEKLVQDYAHLPKFAAFVVSYEEQVVPEARFVRVLDKCMPAMMHFMNDGVILQGHNSYEELMENSKQRAAGLRRDYPEFEELIALREELSKRMADTYLS